MKPVLECSLNFHMEINFEEKSSRHIPCFSNVSGFCVFFWKKILTFFLFVKYLVNNKKSSTDLPALMSHHIAGWHLELAVGWLDLSVCIVMKVVLHQVKFKSLSFSV